MSRRHTETPVWALVAALTVSAAAISLLLVADLPGAPLDSVALPWPALLIGFALAELCVVHVRLGKQMHSFSLDEIPLVLGLFFADPFILIAVRLLGRGAVLIAHRRHPPLKLAFNLAQWWLEAAVAVVLWHTLINGRDVIGPAGWLAAFAVVLVADLIGAASISATIGLLERRPQRAFFWATLWTGAVTASANVCLALVAMAVVVVDWRAAWTLLVLGGLVFAAHRAHAVLRQRHETLERLNHFTQRISADLDVDSVADTVMLEVRELVAAEQAEIVLGDARVLACRPDGSMTQNDDVRGSMSFRLRGRLLEHPVLAPRGTRDAVLRAWLTEVGVRDAVVVPLRVDDRLVGMLAVTNNLGHTGTFSTSDVQVLEALANHAAVAIENARLTQRLHGQVAEKHHQARHDSLTGLPNRVHLHELIEAKAREGASFAVLLLDLDRFKDVNDTLGHAVGDELLKQVAVRLASLGQQEMFLARLGGDEFVLVAPAADDEAAGVVARQVHRALSQSFRLAGVALGMDASLGIAVSPRDGTEYSTLLRRADIAMYAAKQNGSHVEIYSAAIDGHTAEQLALVAELRAVVAARSLAVYYQPKLDLHEGRVIGVEALVRWSHPERGFIPPDEFIPIAERTGLIAALTSHVLDTALAQCATWRAAGFDLGIAVNLSPRVLHAPGFEKDLTAALARHDVAAASLTLEVTESNLMADVEKTITVLRRLRAVGVHLSIDDLGTGYSSLAYLKRLPVDEIKLDKAFVLGMADDPDDEAIVRAIVDVGHRLRMHVVAEGVEDECTYGLLRSIGCDIGQGYWMSRPLPAADVPAWISTWSRRRAAAFV